MLQPRESVLEGISTASRLQHSGGKLSCANEVGFLPFVFIFVFVFVFVFVFEKSPVQRGNSFLLRFAGIIALIMKYHS